MPQDQKPPQDTGPKNSERFITPRPSLKLQAQGRALLRARTRLLVCFWTLPVYIAAVWILLNNGRDIEAFMYIYMGMWGGFAMDMVRRPCPECGHQFFVKTILMNLRTHRCVHCGFDAKARPQPGDKGDEENVTF